METGDKIETVLGNGENKRLFSLRFMIGIAINIALATYFFSGFLNKIDTTQKAVMEISAKMEKNNDKTDNDLSLIRSDISILNSRCDVLEEQIKQLKEERERK